jgi:hypothetical protein
MKTIPLSGKHGSGKCALVDDDIFEKYSHLSWYALPKPGDGFSVRHNSRKDGITHALILARLIMDAPPWQEVDHRDNDGFNNVRSNLRLCAHNENSRNRRKPSNNTSGYKGVFWSKAQRCWHAMIRIDDQLIMLGRFTTREAAALAYNTAAIKYHGEFANLNDIPEEDRPEGLEPIQQGVSLHLHPKNTSGYRGVYWYARKQRWESFITFQGRRICIGWYKEKALAAYVYDQVALQLIGPGARLNILDKAPSVL